MRYMILLFLGFMLGLIACTLVACAGPTPHPDASESSHATEGQPRLAAPLDSGCVSPLDVFRNTDPCDWQSNIPEWQQDQPVDPNDAGPLPIEAEAAAPCIHVSCTNPKTLTYYPDENVSCTNYETSADNTSISNNCAALVDDIYTGDHGTFALGDCLSFPTDRGVCSFAPEGACNDRTEIVYHYSALASYQKGALFNSCRNRGGVWTIVHN